MLVPQLLVTIPMCLAPLLFFAGTFLLVRGLRGYPSLADPTCMKCGYDLRGFTAERPRICSECGADLTAPRSIRLATYVRDGRKAALGAAILAAGLIDIPLLQVFKVHATPAAFGLSVQSPQFIATQTNAQIIANLPTTGGQPWAWQELQRRFAAGTLPPADVTAAIDQFIKFRLAAGPSRTAGPLVWNEQFLQNADAAHLIPPQQLDRLTDAFFGALPVITIAGTVSTGPTPVRIEYGGPWQLLGRTPIFALRSVTLEDGTLVPCVARGLRLGEAHKRSRLSNFAPFSVDADLYLRTTQGSHHLTFIVDTAVIDQDTRNLINGSGPGPADQWPSNIQRHERKVNVSVTYVPEGTPTVEMVTSTANHQWPPYTLQSVAALPGENGTRIKIMVSPAASDVDSDYDVSVTVAGQSHPTGPLFRLGAQSGGSDHSVLISPPLSPEITIATVTLIANMQRATQTAGVSRIWGLPIEWKDVPLRRLDLPATTAPVP